MLLILLLEEPMPRIQATTRSPAAVRLPAMARAFAAAQQNVYANGADLTLWEPYQVTTEMDMTMYNPVTKTMGVAKITESLTDDYHQCYGLLPDGYNPRFEKIVNKWFCIAAKVKAGTNKYVVLNPFFDTGDSYIIFDLEKAEIFASGTFEDPEAMTDMSGFIDTDGEGMIDIAFICRLNPNGKILVDLSLSVASVGSARPINGVGGFVFLGTGLDFYCAAAQGALCNHLTPFAYAGVDENVDNGNPRNLAA